jgi:hypothetical protein
MARFRSARRICPAPEWGRLAQLVEQLTLNQRVVGSNPSASTIFCRHHSLPPSKSFIDFD